MADDPLTQAGWKSEPDGPVSGGATSAPAAPPPPPHEPDAPEGPLYRMNSLRPANLSGSAEEGTQWRWRSQGRSQRRLLRVMP